MPAPNGVTVHGNPAPIQTQLQEDRFLVDAKERRLTFRGERVAMESAFPSLAFNSVRATYRQDGASGTAEIILKDGTSIVDVVEIDFNSEQRAWYRAPANVGFSNHEQVAIAGKAQELEQFAASDKTPAEVLAEMNSMAAALGGDLGDAFLDLIRNGPTYLALLPVVTWTRTVGPTFANPFVILDIGKVFSTAAMTANLPLNPQLAVDEVTNTVAANSLQTLGWLKAGRYSVASDGGVQYIQQYTFDSWPTRRYEFVL